MVSVTLNINLKDSTLTLGENKFLHIRQTYCDCLLRYILEIFLETDPDENGKNVISCVIRH